MLRHTLVIHITDCRIDDIAKRKRGENVTISFVRKDVPVADNLLIRGVLTNPPSHYKRRNIPYREKIRLNVQNEKIDHFQSFQRVDERKICTSFAKSTEIIHNLFIEYHTLVCLREQSSRCIIVVPSVGARWYEHICFVHRHNRIPLSIMAIDRNELFDNDKAEMKIERQR